MEERPANTTAEPIAAAAATDPAQQQSNRASLMRRFTPHMPHMPQMPQMPHLPQVFSSGSPTPHPEPSAFPGENTRPQSPIGSKVAGLKRGLSYQRPGVPHLVSNVDFPAEALVTHENKLADFRRLAGIDNSPSHLTSSGYSRAGENIGIYAHVVRQEASCKSKYTRYSLLINASLGLQLIFAAAVTAVAAGDGPRSGIVILGAINTVLAGFLTFTKGSGLPNREKYYAGEWTKLRDHIEQREREFGRSDCALDVDTEIRQIEAMFLDIKQDVEANTPDGFTSVATKRGIGPSQPQKSSMMSPSTLESGFGASSLRPASSVMLAPQQQYQRPQAQQQMLQPQPQHAQESESHGLPNIFEKLNSSVDPSSRTSQVLSKLSGLQAKYGDTILEKLHSLEHHDNAPKDSEKDIGRSLDNTISSSQNQALSHVNEVSSIVNNEAAYLATAGQHAQVAGEAAARDLAEHAAATGRGTASHVQGEANRAAGMAQAEADKLIHVGQQAESAARNISTNITSELRGFFGHHSEHENK